MKQNDFRAAAIVVLGLLALPGVGYAAGTSSSAPAEQPDLYKQAKELVDAKQYAQAIPLLQKSIQQKGEYADALNLLGYSNRKLGDMRSIAWSNRAGSRQNVSGKSNCSRPLASFSPLLPSPAGGGGTRTVNSLPAMLGVRESWARSWHSVFAGLFLSNFLPGTLGSDGLRVVLLTKS